MSVLKSLPGETPVLIVGGGPVGMTCALLLAKQGIKSLVVERGNALPTTPRAHVIRKRSMDIFEKIDAADEIYAAVPGPETRFITWVAQLAGKEIGRLDMARDGVPSGWANLPQNLLCPILLDHMTQSEWADIATYTDCTAIQNGADGVTATLKQGEAEQTIAARWLIAADGAGSPTRDSIGIGMSGPDNLAQFYMVHFKADLTKWVADRPGPLFWILNPEGNGTLIVHELTKSHVYMVPAKDQDGDEAALLAYMRRGLGGDMPIEILSSGRWTAHSQIADSYRQGRAFLVGDAAHRFPPSGGLGLNTGILDVHNFAWKLALVEKGLASDALLDSYDMECRSVASTNADASVHNMATLFQVYEALGPFGTLAELENRLDTLTADEKTAVQTAIDNQTSHFTSDGILPGTWTGEPHRDLTLPWHYGSFKLLIKVPPQWAGPVKALEQKHNIRIEVYPFLQAQDHEGFLKDKTAVLLRPDDQVAWIGETPDDLKTALEYCLAGPSENVTKTISAA